MIKGLIARPSSESVIIVMVMETHTIFSNTVSVISQFMTLISQTVYV